MDYQEALDVPAAENNLTLLLTEHKNHREETKRAARQMSSWSPRDEQRLLEAVKQKGFKWAEIALIDVPNHSADQCRDRFMNHVDPTIVKGNWTRRDFDNFFEGLFTYGRQFARISRRFMAWVEIDPQTGMVTEHRRSELDVKNHFYHCIEVHLNKLRKESQDPCPRDDRDNQLVDHEHQQQLSPTPAMSCLGTRQMEVPPDWRMCTPPYDPMRAIVWPVSFAHHYGMPLGSTIGVPGTWNWLNPTFAPIAQSSPPPPAPKPKATLRQPTIGEVQVAEWASQMGLYFDKLICGYSKQGKAERRYGALGSGDVNPKKPICVCGQSISKLEVTTNSLLRCYECGEWFHSGCSTKLDRRIYHGEHVFLKFRCRRCNVGSELLCEGLRTWAEMGEIGIVNLMLETHRSSFKLDEIAKYLLEHWDNLCELHQEKPNLKDVKMLGASGGGRGIKKGPAISFSQWTRTLRGAFVKSPFLCYDAQRKFQLHPTLAMPAYPELAHLCSHEYGLARCGDSVDDAMKKRKRQAGCFSAPPPKQRFSAASEDESDVEQGIKLMVEVGVGNALDVAAAEDDYATNLEPPSFG